MSGYIDISGSSDEDDPLAELFKIPWWRVNFKYNFYGRSGRRPLHIAIDRVRPDLVRHLLEKGASTKQVDEDGYTPLFSAARFSEDMHMIPDDKPKVLEIVKTLCEYGADPCWRSGRFSSTPIYRAYRGGLKGVFEILISQTNVKLFGRYQLLDTLNSMPGPRSQMLIKELCEKGKIKDSYIALKLAARHGITELVVQYCQKGVNPNRLLDFHDSPLLCAVRGNINSLKSAEVLCNAGADVECRDAAGQRPLHFAAEHGNLALTKLLYQWGANVNSRTRYGDETPLYTALKHGRADIANFLLLRRADPTILSTFSRELFVEDYFCSTILSDEVLLRSLLDKGLDANLPTREGTLLHTAIELDYEDAVVSTLCEFGANVNAKNRWGDRPFVMAAAKERIDTMLLLNKYGVDHPAQSGAWHGFDPITRDYSRKTPLFVAVRAGESELVDQLCYAGHQDELTHLSQAISDGFPEVVKVICSHQKNLNFYLSLRSLSREQILRDKIELTYGSINPVVNDNSANLSIYSSFAGFCAVVPPSDQDFLDSLYQYAQAIEAQRNEVLPDPKISVVKAEGLGIEKSVFLRYMRAPRNLQHFRLLALERLFCLWVKHYHVLKVLIHSYNTTNQERVCSSVLQSLIRLKNHALRAIRGLAETKRALKYNKIKIYPDRIDRDCQKMLKELSYVGSTHFIQFRNDVADTATFFKGYIKESRNIIPEELNLS